jgi:hypothetical protein
MSTLAPRQIHFNFEDQNIKNPIHTCVFYSICTKDHRYIDVYTRPAQYQGFNICYLSKHPKLRALQAYMHPTLGPAGLLFFGPLFQCLFSKLCILFFYAVCSFRSFIDQRATSACIFHILYGFLLIFENIFQQYLSCAMRSVHTRNLFFLKINSCGQT